MRPFVLGIVASMSACAPAVAADTVTYDVALDGAGDLDGAIRGSAQLFSLHDAGAIPPFALIERARQDEGRIKTVLDSFGYYAGTVAISIAGKGADDPALITALDAAPNGQSVPVTVTIGEGPLYRLGTIAVTGSVPDKDRSALNLAAGDPAVASVVLAAQANLLTAMQEDGFAFASVDEPLATANDTRHVIDLVFHGEAGPRVRLGTLKFKGLKDVNEDFVRNALTVHSGDLYKPSAIESARQTLAGLGVFSGASVRGENHPNPDDSVDLVFDVQEREMHTVSFSASYSTDLGASASAGWQHHNLFGNAEQLNLSAAITDVGGTASSGVGYDIAAQFIEPRFLGEDRTFEADIAGVKDHLDAYNRTAETVSLYLRQKFSTLWSATVGLTGGHDEIEQEGANRIYELAAVPITFVYDGVHLANPLADPIDGFRGQVSATPTVGFGSTDPVFVILQASGSAYFDLSGDGTSVLALRALVGSIQGATSVDVPPDRRLYAGGSATVRGFRYQSIGPRFADQNPIGAASVDAATIEFRQRLFDEWGGVVFLDAGQASANSAPFNGELNVGAGIGARYYTPIGAVRADFAVPLTQFNNRDSFEIYLGLGQAF